MNIRPYLILCVSIILFVGVVLAGATFYGDQNGNVSQSGSQLEGQTDTGTVGSNQTKSTQENMGEEPITGPKESVDKPVESEQHKAVSIEDPPAEKRYVNEHRTRTPPEWVPEENVSLKNTSVRAYEVTRYPNVQPTEEHLDAAWELYNRSYEAAKERGLFEFENASKAGYKKHDPYHFFSEEYYFNDENLNPRAPEGLVYFRNYTEGFGETEDRILAGYVYWVDSLETEGEQVAGPLTTWHYHPQDKPRCFASRLGKGFEFERRDCSEEDVKMYRSPEMIHVWFIKHPEGPFSTEMGPYGWATEVFEEINTSSDGVPEKIPEEEFKRYAEDRHEEYFMAESATNG